ncbi:MAG: cob(I)yrinic acid a,c-diamide adenosyltransferase [Emticicia sp.]|nr:cob(I)yrinic acid a,c-diamide adenosyltransferase [Emticicia sp.]
MKIYTKTGDKGQTSLFGGARLPKNHIRIEAYGTVDELNSYIGLVRDVAGNETVKTVLKEIQDRLFTIGSNLASDPSKDMITPDIHQADIRLLETEIDSMMAELPPLRNFILPGGHTTVSFCHIARCVCRRTERLVVALAENEKVELIIIQYLNRLSDYLFALGRLLAKDLAVEEVKWEARK